MALQQEPDRGRSDWWYAGGSVGLTVAGVVASALLSIPAVVVGTADAAGFTLAVVLGEAGFALVAVGFVLVTGRGLGYFDLSAPPSWAFVLAVTLVLFVFRTAAVAAALALNLSPSPPSLVEAEIPVETLLAVMIPTSLFVIGPAEELLFRGTVQKYLRERFTATTAIVGAGLLFAVIHVFALVVATGVGALVSLGIIFVVGLAMGWLYERTGTVLAPMVAHGCYNALIFASGLLLTRLV